MNLLKFIHLLIPSMTTYGVLSTARPPSMCGDLPQPYWMDLSFRSPEPTSHVVWSKKEETASAHRGTTLQPHILWGISFDYEVLPFPIGVWAAPSRACGSFIKSQGLINSLWLFAYQMSEWMNEQFRMGINTCPRYHIWWVELYKIVNTWWFWPTKQQFHIVHRIL